MAAGGAEIDIFYEIAREAQNNTGLVREVPAVKAAVMRVFFRQLVHRLERPVNDLAGSYVDSWLRPVAVKAVAEENLYAAFVRLVEHRLDRVGAGNISQRKNGRLKIAAVIECRCHDDYIFHAEHRYLAHLFAPVFGGKGVESGVPVFALRGVVMMNFKKVPSIPLDIKAPPCSF